VFVFAELLELPNIQELATSEQHAPFLSLLQLFSYRTFRDYLEHKNSLPQLNPAQITKLKYLTIVSLAEERHILPYSLLLEELQIESIRELEDLIIDAIYLDILRGKLDQKEQQLEIEYTMGRDLEPGKLEKLLEALKNWANTTANVLSELDQKLMEAATYNATVQLENEEHERAYQSILRDVQERHKDGKVVRRLQLAQNDSMDVDEPPPDGPRFAIRNRKPTLDAALKQSQRKRTRA